MHTVPRANAVFEKRKWFARFKGLEPEIHFAQLDCHRVHINTVDAVPDHIAEGDSDRFW